MATVHVIAPFHSRLMKEHWSHCAFTQITLKQIEIFKRLGHHVIDYSNYGSESTAHEHVELLSKDLFEQYFSDDGKPGHEAVIGSVGHARWLTALILAECRMQEPGEHIVAHTFGDSAASLVPRTTNASHFESHVGYDRMPFGVPRVYVSEAWRHFMWGKYPNQTGDRRYSWVILPYYDKPDWPEGPGGDYIAFMGRIVPDKGITTIKAIAEARPDWKFKVAGSGDLGPFQMPSNVEHMGILPGNERAAFLGGASVQILPTEYIEPCAGSVIEGMLCGTPAVTSSWGGFTETVETGRTGYRAATLQEWIDGIDGAARLMRQHVAYRALGRFTLEAAEKQYAHVFEQLLSLRTSKGWYQTRVAA